jgi:hypothetical protein
VESWVTITKFYALVAIFAVVLLTASAALLALKVRRLVRLLKSGPRRATETLKGTGDAARARGDQLTARGKAAWASTRESLTRAAAHLDEAGRVVATSEASEPGLFETLLARIKPKREA